MVKILVGCPSVVVEGCSLVAGSSGGWPHAVVLGEGDVLFIVQFVSLQKTLT
jgi:hypothetical protein